MSDPLDAVQLAALRRCDTACFVHHEGTSYIRAIKRAERTTRVPFAVDQEIVVNCDTKWTDYAREFAQSWPMPDFSAFASVGNYDDSEWRTVASMLRKGDVLTLYWQRDAGSTDALREAGNGFHLDRLSLVVQRRETRLRFHIAGVLCQDNTARMIRNVRSAARVPSGWAVADTSV